MRRVEEANSGGGHSGRMRIDRRTDERIFVFVFCFESRERRRERENVKLK